MSDDNTRRHWHGSPGDRHEHLNVWMNGGAKARSPRAAWAMPAGAMETGRRASDSSTTSQSKQDEATSPPIPTVSERRRSSGGSGGLFSNLQSQKRLSTDPGMAGRRASWNEQAAKGGFFGKWWDEYTRGPSTSK
ncbi:uncharacterized protein N7515_001709 [Penicillium bovifimosum]|uniref:Uncharacterized protein n=1 Tax=Penicillium bovifimosum TaxID=126998 RepID=A0A9W9L910_9EURO|nr:uncharacterized protein N7515_001709 [Penicillium bovifimosum]KAJ5142922.1 hypothetical protein N7515_001709 [Penicillium bovifimosum]